jgi:hypothetical protein
MIVTISGWVFIVIALLGIFQLKHVHSAQLIAAAASLVLYAVVAAGLLSRRNWGRWLALGLSLVTWTAGSLFFLYITVTFYRLFSALGGVTEPRLAVIMLVLVAFFAAVVWLNFKLFDHLNSDEGREEFGAPSDERYAVTKSTLVQVVWWVVGALVFDPAPHAGGRLSEEDISAVLKAAKEATRERASAGSRQPEPEVSASLTHDPFAPDPEAQADARRLERQAQSLEAPELRRDQNAARRDAQKEHMRKTRALLERRVRDRSYTDAQFDADNDRLTREYARALDSASGATAPATRASDSRDETPTKILRCRDASGSIQFTQGYCPAGTTLVESPPAD